MFDLQLSYTRTVYDTNCAWRQIDLNLYRDFLTLAGRIETIQLSSNTVDKIIINSNCTFFAIGT